MCVCVWRCVCCCSQRERWVVETQLFLWIWSVQWVSDSPSRILRSLNLSQNHANSAIFQIAADFALRRVLWRHRNAHSVKERLFLSSKMEWTALRSLHARFTRATLDKRTESGTNPRYSFGLQTVYLLGPAPRAALDHATPLYTALGDTVKKVVELAAESITFLSDLVRSIQIRHRIMLKLQISEQTPLMWKTGETLFNKHKSPPFTINLI